MVVQRGCLDRDDLPAVRRRRVRALTESQSSQRVIGIDAGGGDSEHARTLAARATATAGYRRKARAGNRSPGPGKQGTPR